MTTAASWPESPYKGLSFYTPEDVALFGGRQADVRECARLLAKESTKVLLLHGKTGCGKSSFLRAGLIPFLESEVRRFQFFRHFDVSKTKAFFIRCTDAPLHRLCERLYDWGEAPFLIDPLDSESLKIDPAEIRGDEKDRTSFIEKNGTSVDSLLVVLRAIHNLLPKTSILVIDQGEEILTLKPGKEGLLTRKLFFDFIAAFSKTSLDLKLVVALRSEYFGDFFDEMKRRQYNSEQLEFFLLKELSTEQLVEAIKIPTSNNIPRKYLQGRCQPADAYNFSFEPSLPEQLVDDLMRVKPKGGVLRGGVLPVLQITCERLYKQAKTKRARGRKRWIITAADYKALGDLDKQVDLYLDENILEKINQELPKLDDAQRDEELALWKDLLYQLVIVEDDNRALTIIRREEELRKSAEELRCKVDFKKMIAFLADDAQRILREDQRGREVLESWGDSNIVYYYSLGHDAIAAALSKWRETRELVLGRRSFVRNVLQKTTIGIAALCLLGAAIVLVGLPRNETWWSGVSIIASLLLAGGVLLVARTRISESLARKIANSAMFHGLFGETEPQSRETQDAIRRMQLSFDAGEAPEPSIGEREVLKGAEELLKAKPERDYTTADWEQRAFAAYADGKVDLAAEYFRQAAVATDATPTLRALYTYNRGVLFGELQRSEEALAAYDEVTARYQEGAEPTVCEWVAKALYNKGVALGQLNRSEDELAVYEDVVQRFGTATEPALREQVAKALYNKGVALGQLNRSEEALAVYEDVVQRFGTVTELEVQESVAVAMNGIGFQMLCQAKKARIEGDEPFAQEYLLKAQEKIRMADERRPENPFILGNLAYIAFLLDHRAQAYHFLSRAIAIGGEEIRQIELRDAEIYKLPQDEEFQALVLSI